MRTLSYQVVQYDSTTDPVADDFNGPVIAVFWHEYLLLPFYLRGHSNTAILTSRHRDAEWLSEAAGHLGFEIIRGSTARGGSQAMLELVRVGDKNVGIACDGPRGPRRTMAPGPVFLSSKLQIPLITYGIGFDRPKRTRSWDKFAIPRPFSRARWIVGPRMQIPTNLSRDGVEHYRRQVEGMLNILTDEAECWASTGERRPTQISAHRCAMPVRNRRKPSAASEPVQILQYNQHRRAA